MKILDCTLRDGGYYTKWHFTDEIVFNYLKLIEKLPINYIEIGYLNPKIEGFYGRYYFLEKKIIKKIKSLTSKKIAVMIDAKNFDYNNDVSVYSDIDLVRVAINPNQFEAGLKVIKHLNKMGLKIAGNVMYGGSWNNIKNIYTNISKLTKLVNYTYIVDSYGSLDQNKMNQIFQKIDLNNNIFGFHGHDNLSLGLSNTIHALKNGCEIVDSTVTGMGRGSGNLKTELLLTYFDKLNDNFKIDYFALSSLVDLFDPLQKKYNWGQNLAYMVTGKYNIEQSKVMEEITLGRSSIKTIVNNLFKIDYKLKEAGNQKVANVLLIAGGNSVLENIKPIKEWIVKNREDVLLVFVGLKHYNLFKDLNCDKILVITGTEIERIDFKLNKDCIIITSEDYSTTLITNEMVRNSFYVKNLLFDKTYEKSHSSIALNFIEKTKCNKIFCVGYDGYENMTERQQELFLENLQLFSSFKKPIISLTQSSYPTLHKDSIFKYLL